MSAVKAGVTAAATVTTVAVVVVSAPVSVPAMALASVAMLGAAGGAAATGVYAAGAITGDTKSTDAAADAVKIVSNVGGLATATVTGGNMEAAGKFAAATDLVNVTYDVTHPEEAVTGALKAANTIKSATDAGSGTAELLHQEKKGK